MESQSVVKLGQWARVENAPKKAQLSKGNAPATKSSGPPTSNTRSFAKQSRKRVRAKRHIPRRRRREAVGYKGAKPDARTRTNRIGRALRVAIPPAESTPTHDSIRANRKFSRRRGLWLCCIKNAETAAERVETGPNRYEWQPLRKR